jgi:prepilin-type N-terminal cleavage/methylation domain-containing protein/prepilin-type processing-associated H-X9-DG protein
MRRRKTAGFTLIELLVVVAILALLIAILLPSLGRAKTVAMRSRCAATLKGWGMAVNTYQAENAGAWIAKLGGGNYGQQWDQDPKAYGIPEGVGVTDPVTGKTANVVPSLYGNQTGNVTGSKTRFCPADTPGNMGNPGIFYYGNRQLPGYRFVVYWQQTGPGAGTVLSVYNINKFKRLSDVAVMADAASANNYGDTFCFVTNNRASAGPGTGAFFTGLNNNAAVASPRNFNGTGWNTQNELQERHKGFGGVLFLDGHADIVPWSEYEKNIPADPNDVDRTKIWTRMQPLPG